ncbi:uncharacterized protein LOC110018910 [Phalaenopsis equestris]|uniref:uncharacterized protein LOC110018910 n=1 Tax=Phalaenopsis equestris TaxID=78828 RepID=UPI0009E29325|nr:uncharacterized protein LOC110018910 [Phalaenopsis equestris]
MGDEKMISNPHHRRYGSQTISVPFLWEHKPGMPRRHWIAKPIPFVSAKFSESKQVSLSEKAITPLKLVISVPFQWEEKPGKPLVREENPCSTIAPVAFSSWNDSIDGTEKVFNAFSLDSFISNWNQSSFNGGLEEDDSNQNDSWHSVFGKDTKSDSSSSAIQNEVEVKSCTRHRSHLLKRTLTLGELILLSRKLNYPKNAVSIRKHRFFLMVKPSLHEFSLPLY